MQPLGYLTIPLPWHTGQVYSIPFYFTTTIATTYHALYVPSKTTRLSIYGSTSHFISYDHEDIKQIMHMALKAEQLVNVLLTGGTRM
jgi:hypothetical protein